MDKLDCQIGAQQLLIWAATLVAENTEARDNFSGFVLQRDPTLWHTWAARAGGDPALRFVQAAIVGVVDGSTAVVERVEAVAAAQRIIGDDGVK